MIRIKRMHIAAMKSMISMLVVLFICATHTLNMSSLDQYLPNILCLFGHTETMNFFILSVMGRVGIKLERFFSSQVSLYPRLDRFQTPCLPNNLPWEESDQPRQKTRLTVPGCAVKEIRSLTEWSYSISCLTDGGRRLHRETKMKGVKSAWGHF